MGHKETLQSQIALEKPTTPEAPRRFRMRAYSGAPIERRYGLVAFDVSQIAGFTKLPMLINHDPDKVAAFADGLERAPDGGLDLVGTMVSTEYGKEVVRLSDEGFPYTGSIGIELDGDVEDVAEGKEVLVNGKNLKGPVRVWRASHLFETSFVTAGPADRNTQAVVLTDEEKIVDKAEREKLLAEQAAATKAAEREELKKFSDAFPGRPGFGASAFLAGKTLEQAKLEEAALQIKELTEKLAVADKQPKSAGIGFAGAEREQARESFDHLEPDARAEAEWKRDPKYRECFSSVKHVAAYFRMEEAGLKNQGVIPQVAAALVRNTVGE